MPNFEKSNSERNSPRSRAEQIDKLLEDANASAEVVKILREAVGHALFENQVTLKLVDFVFTSVVEEVPWLKEGMENQIEHTQIDAIDAAVVKIEKIIKGIKFEPDQKTSDEVQENVIESFRKSLQTKLKVKTHSGASIDLFDPAKHTK